MLKYAYADAHTWLMKVHLTFLSLSLTCNLIFYTWSPWGEWPLSPPSNSLLLRTKLIPIQECRVYFLWPLHQSIPIKSGQGLAQVILLDSTTLAHYEVGAQYVPLQVLVIIFHSCALSSMHMLYAFIRMLHTLLSSFLRAWFPCI